MEKVLFHKNSADSEISIKGGLIVSLLTTGKMRTGKTFKHL